MKYLGFFFILLGSLSVNALPAAAPAPRLFELMKCSSLKIGTLWASFGHLRRSGSEEITYFPTEIVYFGPDFSARMVYDKLDDALKVDVAVRSGGYHLGMEVPKGDGVTQKHLLQLRLYDPRVSNAFIGNWTVSEPGKADVMDLVACSAD